MLTKSIDFIQYLNQQKKKLENEENKLKKDVKALKLIQKNYESITHNQQQTSGQVEARISDEMKFKLVSNGMS